ncbi:MAG: thiamine-phosphate kinase [Candidatus Sumerlaeaceae bacterium]
MTDQATVQEAGEQGILNAIRPFLSPPDDNLVVSIGDDCAVYHPDPVRPLQVLTTDLLVEDTHFLRTIRTDFVALGRRAIVANVSDMAAMGAQPECALVSIGLPGELQVRDVVELYKGLQLECARWSVRLVGGDTVRAAKLTLNIAVTGSKLLSDGSCARSNCSAGQNVFVSGALGGCRAGLELQLRPELQSALEPDGVVKLIRRQQVPEPRIELGRYLAAHHGDVAIIDVSDGIFNELHLLADASHAGLNVAIHRIPLFDGVVPFCKSRGVNAQQFAMFSGEEFELLFCCRATREELAAGLAASGISVPVTQIGSVAPIVGVNFHDSSGAKVELADDTFQHFGPTQ